MKEILTKNDLGNELYLTLVDGLVILCLNVVFGVAASWKQEDFFVEEVDGVVVNKKVFVDGDCFRKEGLKDHEEYQPYFETRKTGVEDSH